MSLDLYIRSHHPVKHRGTGVFIRDNGQTRELKTVEEVKAHFPDADTSDIDIREWEDDELFHCNMTHNLTEMASHVPIEGTDGAMTLPRDYERDKPDFKPEPLSAYNLLWHPETNPLLKQVHLKGKNSDGEDYEEDVTAIDAELIRQACAVHLYIKAHREELSKYNPSNGWGSYDNLLKCSGDFVKVLLDIPAEEYDNYFLYCWT